MRALLLSLVLVLTLAVPAPADDLSPEVRDVLNGRFRLVQASRTEAHVRSALETVLANGASWDQTGFNADERREAEAFQIEAEANLSELNHRSLSVPAILPTPLADGLLYNLMNGGSLGTPDDVAQWVHFLEAMPDLIGQSVTFLQEKETQGQPYPQLVLTQVASSIDAYFWNPPAFGPIAQYFASQVADPVLQKRVVNVLETKVYPSLKAAKKAIDDLAFRAPTAYTLCVDPESYAAIIFERLGERVPAADLHAGALDDLKRLEREVEFLPPGFGKRFCPGSRLPEDRTRPPHRRPALGPAGPRRRPPADGSLVHCPGAPVRDPVPDHRPGA